MKVIIEISEKLFNAVKEACEDGFCGSDVWESVAAGVPYNLPNANVERPQGELKEYKPLELDYNVQCAVVNLKMAYWSNDTEKYAKVFTDAEEIIINAICHHGYIVCKRPQGDLISREALKKKLRLVQDFIENDENIPKEVFNLIDNAPIVAVNCNDCDGYEAGYNAGIRDAYRDNPPI